jgi:hypothetical protein
MKFVNHKIKKKNNSRFKATPPRSFIENPADERKTTWFDTADKIRKKPETAPNFSRIAAAKRRSKEDLIRHECFSLLCCFTMKISV